MQDLYTEYNKTLLDELKKNSLNEERSCSWVKFSIKMSTLPKFNYMFKVFPIKISLGFYVEIDKLDLKFA